MLGLAGRSSMLALWLLVGFVLALSGGACYTGDDFGRPLSDCITARPNTGQYCSCQKSCGGNTFFDPIWCCYDLPNMAVPLDMVAPDLSVAAGPDLMMSIVDGGVGD